MRVQARSSACWRGSPDNGGSLDGRFPQRHWLRADRGCRAPRREGAQCVSTGPFRTWRSGATRRPQLGGLFLDRGEGRVGVLVALDRLHEVLVDPERLVDLALDLLGDVLVLVQVGLRVGAALADALFAVGEERAGLRDDAVLEPEVEDAARCRDALAELDVELGLAERRRDLVLDDLHADAVA